MSFNFMAAVTICSDFGGQENKVCHCYSIFASSVASQEVILVKNLPASAGDISDKGLIHGSRRYPGEGNGNPLQYSCLENPGTGEPGGLPSIGCTESDTTEATLQQQWQPVHI